MKKIIQRRNKVELSKKAKAKRKRKRIKIYEYCISFVALIGTILAVLDLLQGLLVWQEYIEDGVLVILTIDYIARLFLADNKKEFFIQNIFNLIAIMPFNSMLRIFRITKLAKLLRLSIIGAFPRKAFKKVNEFINTNGLKNMLFFTGVAIFMGSFGIMYAEDMKFGDSVWWAFVTVTTVGYGDLSPHTNLGRVIAAVLMLFGIGLIGSITSTITSYFLKMDYSKDYKEENLELIKKKIDDVANLTDEDIDAICKVLKTMNK